jgi:hypothetical protein
VQVDADATRAHFGSGRGGVENPRLVSPLVHPMGWVYWYPVFQDTLTKLTPDAPTRYLTALPSTLHVEPLNTSTSAMSSATGRRLPPSQVDCKWWRRGYCARGRTCHFRHDEAMAGADNKKAEEGGSKGKAKAKNAQSAGAVVYKNGRSRSGFSASKLMFLTAPSSSTTYPITPPPAPPAQQTCAICLETPDTYGLLINCDHAFCLGMSSQ